MRSCYLSNTCLVWQGGGPALEAALPLSGDGCATSLTEGTVLLQLVEFKAHLVEVVEELHIRRVRSMKRLKRC